MKETPPGLQIAKASFDERFEKAEVLPTLREELLQITNPRKALREQLAGALIKVAVGDELD